MLTGWEGKANFLMPMNNLFLFSVWTWIGSVTFSLATISAFLGPWKPLPCSFWSVFNRESSFLFLNINHSSKEAFGVFLCLCHQFPLHLSKLFLPRLPLIPFKVSWSLALQTLYSQKLSEGFLGLSHSQTCWSLVDELFLPFCLSFLLSLSLFSDKLIYTSSSILC